MVVGLRLLAATAIKCKRRQSAKQAGQKLHNIRVLLMLSAELRAAYQVVIPLLVVSVCGNHEADGLIEHVYLMRLQILNRRRQLAQQLCYERLCLSHLQPDTTISSIPLHPWLSWRCPPAEMSSASSM